MTLVTFQLRQLDIPPGQRLLIHAVDWLEFERILVELGEKRASRIAYSDSILEIRMPLPQHEREKALLGDGVKVLLEALGLDCECFGSATFKQPDMSAGIEPDDCFYIQNQAAVRGRNRFDLAIDPPPDLAIEVDVTSQTQTDAYIRLGVPELWIYAGGELKIYALQAGQYESVALSPTFPTLPVLELVQTLLTQSLTIGRSPALRALRQQAQQLIQAHN
jgi:Uma2 family endonuclease